MPELIGGETRHHEPAGDMALVLYRLTSIDKKLDEQKAENDVYKAGIELRLRNVEDQQARMSERLTVWNLGQAAFTTVASVVAALFGHKP